jgi:hypothetical protein
MTGARPEEHDDELQRRLEVVCRICGQRTVRQGTCSACGASKDPPSPPPGRPRGKLPRSPDCMSGARPCFWLRIGPERPRHGSNGPARADVTRDGHQPVRQELVAAGCHPLGFRLSGGRPGPIASFSARDGAAPLRARAAQVPRPSSRVLTAVRRSPACRSRGSSRSSPFLRPGASPARLWRSIDA